MKHERTRPLERWTNHVATLLLASTGVALFVMRRVMAPADDPFAVVSHPMEPRALALHVLAAPLGVLAIGLLLRGHVLARLRDAAWRRSRRSGWMLALTALPMIASGYLLQVAVDDAWRRAWTWTHVATGAAWMLAWLLHVISARGWASARRRLRAAVPSSP